MKNNQNNSEIKLQIKQKNAFKLTITKIWVNLKKKKLFNFLEMNSLWINAYMLMLRKLSCISNFCFKQNQNQATVKFKATQEP